jgi:hypothetical protein
MVEKPSFEPDFITSPELEEGIINGRITTFTITKESLSHYQEAAEKTNFEVAEIAKPGQHYITHKITNPPRGHKNINRQENKTPIITAVISKFPVKEGYVGIFLKRPPGAKDDTPFHTVRQGIQPS